MAYIALVGESWGSIPFFIRFLAVYSPAALFGFNILMNGDRARLYCGITSGILCGIGIATGFLMMVFDRGLGLKFILGYFLGFYQIVIFAVNAIFSFLGSKLGKWMDEGKRRGGVSAFLILLVFVGWTLLCFPRAA